MRSDTPTAIFVTALPAERQAAVAHLRDVEQKEHPKGTVYWVGTFSSPRATWNVGVAEIGMGNARAAFETERAIEWFAPSHCFFVGVAGGLKDVRIGDVVVASKVYGYELGKAMEKFAPRPDFGSSAYALVQNAQAVAGGTEWHRRIDGGAQTEHSPQALIAPIAAGEKVVASKDAAAYRLLKESFSDAAAVEMEGYGFFQAVWANGGVRALAVRGISDLIEGKAEADASGSQELAARHAAAFAFEVLARTAPLPGREMSLGELGDMTTSTESREESDPWPQLSSLAEELYPQGPVDSQVWMRAGGDLSLLDLSGPGRSQWFGALRTLRLGGGGAGISPESLLDTMIKDYPSNSPLGELKAALSS